jgi:dinuclear metal center YbgI/SA1388 family protein
MIVTDFVKYLQDWAPPGAAWENDNVGLLVGAGNRNVKKIFLCLELNRNSLNQALKNNCNFIVTHHPFIFKPIKKLDFQKDAKASLLNDLIKNDISLFTAHTNLDFTKGGVSYNLADRLSLKNVRFLKNEASNQFKLVTFVPAAYSENVSQAVFDAGGGVIGEYNKCSFRSEGFGTFEGSEQTNPAVGSPASFETVEELRLEFLVDAWKLNGAISALTASHPYEEPAYDVYPLKNKNSNYGFGALGEFEKSFSVKEFLEFVVKNLKCKNLRYADGRGRIKKVAVCGGSGADLLYDAISSGADAFVTADIKYHTFEEAHGKILLIDAGHYETEVHVLDVLKYKIENFLRENNCPIKVIKFKGSTNPVKFYK